jgi:hypothetical protein
MQSGVQRESNWREESVDKQPNSEAADDRLPMSELDEAKIADRRSLLSEEPAAAQAKVNQTLHPHLWTLAKGEAWEERLPRVTRVFEQSPDSEQKLET